MSPTEMLRLFAIAVMTARDLRKLSPHNRGPNWTTEMRRANALVDELVDQHLAGVDLADLPELPLPAPAPVDVAELPMPAAPPVPSAESRTYKPPRKKRVGQHND